MIEEICSNIGITNYTINPDQSIDVNGDVSLNGFRLDKLPLKFNKVNGNFYCHDNHLTTLEGSPKYVVKAFKCCNNFLTSLEGCPTEVGGYFACKTNKLTSLVGCPNKVGGDFYCDDNNLTSLVGVPKELYQDFYCRENNITDLIGFDCKLNGDFYCSRNPIGSIFGEVEYDFIYAFKVYQVINGNEVNLRRLKYVMSTWNLAIKLGRIKEYYKIV